MKKIFYLIPIVVLAISISIFLQPRNETDTVYHVTLADPKLYNNGTFSDNFKIQNGAYQFNFVPNGDSPQTLSILLNGENFSYSEDFKLKGTLHNTGISNYYTWDYDGRKTLEIQQDQQVQIKINPHGNLLGSVSVYLVKK